MNSSAGNDDRWILRSRQLLDRDIAQLDAATQRRIAAAREHALQPRRVMASWPIGVALAAAAAAIAAVLVWRPLADVDPSGPIPAESPGLVVAGPAEQVLTLPPDDLALVSSDEDLALLEDLEFYAWWQSEDGDG